MTKSVIAQSPPMQSVGESSVWGSNNILWLKIVQSDRKLVKAIRNVNKDRSKRDLSGISFLFINSIEAHMREIARQMLETLATKRLFIY